MLYKERLTVIGKSTTIKFGKHKGMRMEWVIVHGKNWIVWIYYNVQYTTFADSILERVGLTGKFAIPKPGISPALMKEFVDKFGSLEYTEETIIVKNHEN